MPIHIFYCTDGSCACHKFCIHVVIKGPLPIIFISSNLVFKFIDSPGFKVGKSLKITLVGLTFYKVSAVMGSVSSSSLDY